jgi:hypothetical protein
MNERSHGQIITSAENIERKIAEAPYTPYDDRTDQFIGSGFAIVDSLAIPFSVDAEGGRVMLGSWVDNMRSAITIYQTATEAIAAIIDRQFAGLNIPQYRVISIDDSAVMFAVGAKSPQHLMLAIYIHEDLAMLASISGYKTRRQRIVRSWYHPKIIESSVVEEIFGYVNKHAFTIHDDLSIGLQPDHFHFLATTAHMPKIDVEVNLEGFTGRNEPHTDEP